MLFRTLGRIVWSLPIGTQTTSQQQVARSWCVDVRAASVLDPWIWGDFHVFSYRICVCEKKTSHFHMANSFSNGVIVDVFTNLCNFARHLCWYALLTYCFFCSTWSQQLSTIPVLCLRWLNPYTEIGVASFWAYESPSSSTWVYRSCGTALTWNIMVLVRFVDLGGDTRQKSCSEKQSSCIFHFLIRNRCLNVCVHHTS